MDDLKRRRVRDLLRRDIVKHIVGVLGYKKMKRAQIVRAGGMYEEGGHIGGTLLMLTREGILIHERPFYWVSPEWYGELGICPDKDAQ
jgi:hypothetical protein